MIGSPGAGKSMLVERVAGRLAASAILCLVGVLASGCVFLDVQEQQTKIDANCIFSGSVATEHASDHSRVVVLARQDGLDSGGQDAWTVFDHFVLEDDGRWFFYASPGTYAFAAFEDVSSDLIYQPTEPVLRLDWENPHRCAPGEEVADLNLIIPSEITGDSTETYDIAELQARNVYDQMRLSLGLLTAVGDITTLDDPRFSIENASKGLWRPFDFLLDARPGIYLLQPFDADKIPVLFVHGMAGSPRSFGPIIDALDHSRFQPWVYYYPSGIPLQAAADHLHQTVLKLRRQYRFDRYAVVAHSMGGLVSRAFILKHARSPHDARIPIFVSIATPWNCHAAAQMGVNHAPAVVYSWYDMAPGSLFLTSLFDGNTPGTDSSNTMPQSVEHHLIFTFQRNSSSFGESDDHTVTVASQLRLAAQKRADRIYGLDETHSSVLESNEGVSIVNGILASTDW